MQIINKIW